MTEVRDTWTSAYVNDLPDSAFLMIMPGGHKDAQGKTVPRSLRMFPVKNAAGDPDPAHVRNALARIPQASTLTAAQREAAMAKCKAMAKGMAGVAGDAGEYTGSAGSGRAREPSPLMLRTFDVELEVRTDGEGRTLIGRAVPYGQTIDLPGGDGKERFAFGAFARQVEGGPSNWGHVKLYDSHSSRMAGQQPIGKTAMLTEHPDGLHGAWPLYQTSRANDALELVRTGEVTGLSIGFKVTGRPTMGPDGAYERTAAHLDHIVLTHEPAYSEAAVTAIRTAHPLASFRLAQARHHQVLERIR